MKAAAVVLAAAALTAACASSSEKGSSTAAPQTSLTVEVRADENAAPQQATLKCDGTSVGTGFLAGDAARKACAAVAAPAAAAYLRNPEPQGQVCTQIFSGPERAHVSGTLAGQTIDAQLGRSNGCETAGWELLKPLLQP